MKMFLVSLIVLSSFSASAKVICTAFCNSGNSRTAVITPVIMSAQNPSKAFVDLKSKCKSLGNGGFYSGVLLKSFNYDEENSWLKTNELTSHSDLNCSGI